jgi:uncharacterized protein YgiM (DUF1202 family)
VKRLLILIAIVSACASPAPPPVESTPEPERPTTTEAEPTQGTVRVIANSLNVRRDPSATAEVVSQVSKGTRLTLLATDGAWMRVRLADGAIGFVSAQHVTRDDPQPRRSRRGCQPDSEYSFAKTPTPSFSDSGAHGIVTVDANVDRNGNVTSTTVISNTTGDPALAFLAEREIKGAKFVAPVRNCVTRAFIFTYKRSF